MATTRTPRRRVPDASTVDPVIFLPAPQSSDTLPLPRQESAASRVVAPTTPANRRSLEKQAVYNARQRFAQLTGQNAPQQPSATKKIIDFDLNEEEKTEFNKSASAVRAMNDVLKTL